MRQDVSAAFFLSQYEKAGLITAIISPFLNLWESKQVIGFLQTIEDDKRRNDSLELLKIMEEVTGDKAVMWGKSIVGFGNWHYKYASGREGDWFRIGFSPGKQALTLYTSMYFKGIENELVSLGKIRTGKSCIYIKSLGDIDKKALIRILDKAYKACDD